MTGVGARLGFPGVVAASGLDLGADAVSGFEIQALAEAMLDSEPLVVQQDGGPPAVDDSTHGFGQIEPGCCQVVAVLHQKAAEAVSKLAQSWLGLSCPFSV